ncbi:alpha-glucosidase C-terminal domain-containing protein [Colwellia sp. MB02u-18]|uniref:alpha-amylase family glycosyl hydrolase n=1 Tax=unclassified Colwellia TaxID=196834 RepID=UPI0015F6E219|nr:MULTISPECIES: alpha-amylase family glycosyl hydrolase [unclassified Colwellia]MBA6225904.1 alpha-glucosidase C-terminal domain-containing protein [Colwellia sp. MB3u-45]MBA6267140.1 alpha-glucosidase C-terminal domain-containing protein [Colwellia sp. MB3u-43]MBA6322064.1 alpha-glucosidase C-terminal domain-containing protein [Colwellia sp. MB02u-19]MBA6325294.1 alpha-glucosidase C-terminal domain-containing protein [Colwellia sp. MB02u-18]MBA6330313.1 alpha-glucosidase C-terminal domain-co
MPAQIEPLKNKLIQQLSTIYHEVALEQATDDIADALIDIMRLPSEVLAPTPFSNHWSEADIVLITYGDSIIKAAQPPLHTLKVFLDNHLKNTINSVHILPFFPYSSDDGFSVIDYSSVNESLGTWQDITEISQAYQLMSDLVINHCSSRSAWFDNFIKGEGIGHDFFFTAQLDDDFSAVVRPRTSPLLKEVNTGKGQKFVWCTFSHDQVDFDFRNPEVLKAFAAIIRQYLDSGVKIFRFDAIAFIWKIVGRDSINLPQTHEIVRLLRTLIESADPQAIIITETNIPNTQNLTYFGNANEAHGIYNFSLPPLLINTLLTGNCLYLKRWLMSMPPSQDGTLYFNFIASHDGIGLRPAEGLLSDTELDSLIHTIESFGGKISWRTSNTGEQKAYEMNIALYDALQGTVAGKDHWNFERFICAHAVMFALEGIPGIYIHSMLGTQNDYKKLANTHNNRSINRHCWHEEALEAALADSSLHHAKVLSSLKTLLNIRIKQPAFHPNATQFTLHLGLQLFGFWRQSQNRKQSIFCVSNVSDQAVALPLSELNLIVTQTWVELITGENITELSQEIILSPYQTVWIANKAERI